MKRMRKITNNIMIQYTILSLIVTLAIGFIMMDNLIKSTRAHSIKIHTKIYIDLVKSMPENYTTIFNVLDQNIENINIDDNKEYKNDVNHLISDLSIMPELTQIKIYSKNRSLIFELNRNEINYMKDIVVLDKAFNGETLHFIHELPQVAILQTYIPILNNNDVIGVVEIVDTDKDFTKFLKESKTSIFTKVLVSGLIFYIILFTLFYRAYSSQQNALNRLNKTQELTIHAMSILAELRDNDTGSHILRTQEYCKMLALELRKNKNYRGYLTKEYIEDLERSAPLHDIGKVGVPDNILLKPGKLTPSEFEIIKKHPGYGAEVLSKVAEKLDYKSYFTIGIQVILHHHENWDGSGYPSGLLGLNIPLSARIMAIADVYDALRTKRPYKDPISHFDSMNIIKDESGIKFDPELVKALINIETDFEKISNKYC